MNSPKNNILKNQNNFSNKTNSIIPEMNNDLPTPVTSDTDLKSCTHIIHKLSSRNNSKTLE